MTISVLAGASVDRPKESREWQVIGKSDTCFRAAYTIAIVFGGKLNKEIKLGSYWSYLFEVS